MRIIFMGSPEFSVPILSSIISAGHDVVAVYCQPPRPAGRGKKERLTPVHSYEAVVAVLHSTHQPSSLYSSDQGARPVSGHIVLWVSCAVP